MLPAHTFGATAGALAVLAGFATKTALAEIAADPALRAAVAAVTTVTTAAADAADARGLGTAARATVATRSAGTTVRPYLT